MEFNVPLKLLLPLGEQANTSFKSSILCSFQEYLMLIDWTGRIIRDDKRGYIDQTIPPILDRLDITPDQWRLNATQFEALHPKRFNPTNLPSRLSTG